MIIFEKIKILERKDFPSFLRSWNFFIFEDWLKMINTFGKVIEGNLSISFLSIDKWLQLKFVNSFFTSED